MLEKERVGNPYLEMAGRYVHIPENGVERVLGMHLRDPDLIVAGSRARHSLMGRYSFAVPNERAIDCLVRHSPIVEIGAGSGYWAKLVAEAGGEILAYDNFSWEKLVSCYGRWHTVLEGDHDTPKQYPERTLFLCWPPHSEPMAHRCLRSHFNAGGQKVIVVGEGPGGCTANRAFFDRLYRSYDEVETIDIPQWFGIHDYLSVWKRQ